MTAIASPGISFSLKEFKDLVPNRLLVRYLLTVNADGTQSVIAQLVSAPGASGNHPEHLLNLRAHLYLDNLSQCRFSEITFVRSQDAHQALADILDSWAEKAQRGYWWKSWLAPKDFVGTLILRKDLEDSSPVVRDLPSSSPLLAAYNGVFTGLLSEATRNAAAAEHFGRRQQEEAGAFRRLASRFGTFAQQSQAGLTASVLGTA